ncbi:MAG: hypothetical protein E6G60_07270 [Actinobacteria bacterium]|nr:MAG: hypothetical protein E6G60_07270 [Actinomycetota bacterium]
MVGDEVRRTRAAPDLELDVSDLAAAYLRGSTSNALARADRVRELRRGALERATALFRTTRPCCPEVF